MSFLHKTAIVTGAGQGIGFEICRQLVAAGANVILNDVDPELAAAAANKLSATGVCTAVAGDAGSITCIQEMVDKAAAAYGALDIVIANAGITLFGDFFDYTPDAFYKVMQVNLGGSFFLAQAAASRLRAARGVIVNIADLAAFETWPAYLPHGISKSGVVHLTRSLARVLAPEVRVAGIAPGTVLLPENWDAGAAEHLRETTPLGRSGSPADVTSTVLFILDSDYLTGETIIVDGGRHVRR